MWLEAARLAVPLRRLPLRQLAPHPRGVGSRRSRYAYVEDESTLPIAVQRKLDRERRAKQLERHTKDSIRKQKARERAEVMRELIKYVLMMLLFFYVLDSRRSVRSAYLLTDAVRARECNPRPARVPAAVIRPR